MTNKRLTWLILAIVLIFGMTLVSCGETGGTIIIENNSSSRDWDVAISSSSSVSRYSSSVVTISHGKTYSRSFADDGTYYAYGLFTGGWVRKTVYLSGGEIVRLNGNSF